MIGGSLNYVTWKNRKAVVADPKPIYKTATADEAARQLMPQASAVVQAPGLRACNDSPLSIV